MGIAMFTPEFISETERAFVLVANHNLDSDEAVRLSIGYNLSRIAFGLKHAAPRLERCRLVYDIRGQMVGDEVVRRIHQALDPHCILEFKR